MPRQTIEYRCLLISPGDVTAERDALVEVVNKWNAQIGKSLNTRVELVRWESHATPDMSDKAQNIINKQLLEECDLGIAVFWSRLGTPTTEFPSGSVEEIYRLIQKGVRVLVYFCDRPIPQGALSTDQYAKLLAIRNQFQEQGLLATYGEVSALRESVHLHLTNVISQMLAKDRGTTSYLPASGTMTAPTPDVRVVVRTAIANLPLRGTVSFITISVRNHSPVPVYLSNIFIERKDGHILIPTTDFLTGEWQKRKELQPGDSADWHWDPALIQEHLNEGLVCGAASDQIGRIYRSSESELHNALKLIFDKADP